MNRAQRRAAEFLHTTDQIPQWLSMPEAGARIGVKARTIRAWIADGRLPAYRVGGRAVRIKASDVDALVTPIDNGGAA